MVGMTISGVKRMANIWPRIQSGVEIFAKRGALYTRIDKPFKRQSKLVVYYPGVVVVDSWNRAWDSGSVCDVYLNISANGQL